MIDKCTKKIAETKNFDTNQLFGIIRANGRNLDITSETILNASYGSKHIHLIFNLLYQNFNYIPSYKNNLPQVDHIFPQSLLKKIKEVGHGNQKKNVLKYKIDVRNQIANCMLLTAEENGSSGKTNIPPSEWFKGKNDAYLDMHLIPKNKTLWEVANFEKFIEERRKLFQTHFDYMIQK